MPDPVDVAHLLRRTGFVADPARVAALAAQPWDVTVDQLLDTTGVPSDTEPAFFSEGLADWQLERQLQLWWLERMRTAPVPIVERMALFWHGHFATENQKVGDSLLMYRQNALFRRLALGSFRQLVQEMSVQPAMLAYLDNDKNRKGAPNENFARELMELFTLGVNEYSQPDVVASARAWTGHNTLDGDPRQYHFYLNRHDTDPKTFMGETRAWDGPEIIDYLLDENPTTQATAARFIARKLFGHLAYPDPPDAVLGAIAAEFVAADLEIRALVRAILLHPAFLSPEARAGHVRTPVEWVVCALQVLGLDAPATNPQWWLYDMGQLPFEPPHVAGWEDNGFWLSTGNVWARANFARHATWRIYSAGTGLLAETKAMTVPAAVQRAFDVFTIDTPSPATRARLEEWLAAQRGDGSAWRELQVLNLITLMMLTPEFTIA
ncbi:MAG TPA: DUF1800 domain-containing protein [Acidimicrobiia bacterium]|nr:DUF1800 domain-containing protein [Acidimicrobiia bacterium]